MGEGDIMDKYDVTSLRLFSGWVSLVLCAVIMIMMIYLPIEHQLIPINVDANINQCEETIKNYETLFTEEIIGWEAGKQKEIPFEYRQDLERCRVIVNSKEIQLTLGYMEFYLVRIVFIIGGIISCFVFVRTNKVLNNKETKKKGRWDEVKLF